MGFKGTVFFVFRELNAVKTDRRQATLVVDGLVSVSDDH